jgi:hypothetical protein
LECDHNTITTTVPLVIVNAIVDIIIIIIVNDYSVFQFNLAAETFTTGKVFAEPITKFLCTYMCGVKLITDTMCVRMFVAPTLYICRLVNVGHKNLIACR